MKCTSFGVNILVRGKMKEVFVSSCKNLIKDRTADHPPRKDALLANNVVPWSIMDWNNIEIDCFLGRGSFTHVHKGRVRSSSCDCAIKSLNPTKSKHPSALTRASKDLLQEALLLAELGRHDNLVGLLGILPNLSSSSNNSNMESGVILLLEYLEETLAARLKKWKMQEDNAQGDTDVQQQLSTSTRIRNAFLLAGSDKERLSRLDDRIRQAAMGIANGLSFLHGKQIIHRDLKPQNIGFDASCSGTVKLFDLGMARKLQSDVILSSEQEQQSNPTMGEVAGTWEYMAPETMKGCGSDYASDVYSFGCVLSEICTLQRPYDRTNNQHRNLHQWKLGILDGERPSLSRLPKAKSTAVLRRCILQCWQEDPKQRPDIHSISNDLVSYCSNTRLS
eukprot:scaffold305_cov110-Cylindrotheca_fusiformis.AAC.15